MLTGCCTTIDNYDKVAAAGYETITLAAVDISAMDSAAFARAKNVIRGGPLRLLSLNRFCGADVHLNGPAYTPAKLENYAAPLFERAAALGAKYIGIGSPASRNLAPGVDAAAAMQLFENAITQLCSLAAPYGIEILIEAVCDIECNFITTTPEALDLSKRLDLPNLRLVYDIYHAHMMKEPLENIDDAAEQIRVVHIAQDVNHGQRHYLDETKTEEYSPYIKKLQTAGYKGEVSLEAFQGEIEKELPKSLNILKTLL